MRAKANSSRRDCRASCQTSRASTVLQEGDGSLNGAAVAAASLAANRKRSPIPLAEPAASLPHVHG